MRRDVQDAVDRFIQELEAYDPDVTAELIDEVIYSADAWVRVKCSSQEQINDIMDKVAQLTTKYYLDEGIYIQASASHSGPLKVKE